MRQNAIKAKIKAGEPVIGTFISFPSPHAIEICGLAGLEFVVIDAEHGPMGPQVCEEMVRAAECVGMTPIIRVAQNLPQVILRYLDIGALGVQMPMINTREDAETAVRSVKYWPVGRRGLAGTRGSQWGLQTPLADYVGEANRETMLITHVETLEAVQNLPSMLEVPEIDVIFLGPTDLSQSMGYPGKPFEPAVQELIARLVPQIREAGKAVGTVAPTGDAAKQLIERGFTYILPNVPALLANSVRSYLNAARA